MPELNHIQWTSNPDRGGQSVDAEHQRDGSVRVMVTSGTFGVYAVIPAEEIASLRLFLAGTARTANAEGTTP